MYGVCSSVAPQYAEFLRATAISIGEIGRAADERREVRAATPR